MRLAIRSVPLLSELAQSSGIRGLEVTVGQKTYMLPELCANQIDYSRGEECEIKAKPTMFNYHYVIDKAEITSTDIQSIKTTFKQIEHDYEPDITSMSVTAVKKINPTYEQRMSLLELQRELNTTFIGDIESNRNQGLDGLKKDLEDLDRFDTNQRKSPSINLRCDVGSRFEEKMRYILNCNDYLRFNVQWGGYKIYNRNWNMLSQLMSENKKWCNMVGIFPRRTKYNKKPIRSNLAYGLAHGVHTFCFETTMFRGQKSRSYLLDGDSWCYEESDNDYARDVAQSLNVAYDEVKGISKKIGKASFDEYYGNRVGLNIKQ